MRKMFEHDFIEFDDLETVHIHDKRFYKLPSGKLVESVTTRIGNASDKTALMEWRKKVGEAEAQKISTQAASRGTAIHSICETYLLNHMSYPENSMPVNIETFKTIRPILDRRIGKIFAIEAPLWSETLNTAGRTDCIAQFDGVNSIIDFKTSRKPKKEEWIESYFLQSTCYSLMAEERTPLKVPQIAIIIAVDHDEPQVFVKNRSEFEQRVREIFV